VVDFLATLNFVWQFLNPIGADVVKDRLKQKRLPQAVAAARALSLYRNLRDVSEAVDEFVPTLERFTALEGFGADGDIAPILDRHHVSVEVEECAERIVNRLMKVEKDLNAIDPALSIHQPSLAAVMANITIGEARVAGRAAVPDLLPVLDPEELARILSEARENQKLIADCLEQYRQFVAAEFSFKDLLG
jgi:hypothetical protein